MSRLVFDVGVFAHACVDEEVVSGRRGNWMSTFLVKTVTWERTATMMFTRRHVRGPGADISTDSDTCTPEVEPPARVS